MRIYSLAVTLSAFSVLSAQPPKAPLYSIRQVVLPGDMNKQVCISGMKYLDGKLYFASERCPAVFVADPETGSISRKIVTKVPKEFEMEGMTSYKNNLYVVSENLVSIYELDRATGATTVVETSIPLPSKSKSGDGMEGIAANETNNKFYLLRERNEDMTKAQVYTFSIDPSGEGNHISLKFDSMIELPLQTPQWRYSDICYDPDHDRLLCLKSFSKGKLRQQFIEAIEVDTSGQLLPATLENIPVEKFSEISNQYKDQDFSMNLEGITIDPAGNIYVVSDNTNGKAHCEMPSKEKTILLKLEKNQ